MTGAVPAQRRHNGRRSIGRGLDSGAAGADTPSVTDGPAEQRIDVVAAAAAVVETVAANAMCPGALVVHNDGTLAACSEELDGRCCVGADRPHLGAISCRDLLGLGGCEECAGDGGGPWADGTDVDDPAWRHAVRIGVLAGRPPRCRWHRHHGTAGR